MKTLKKILTTGIIAGSLALGSCGNKEDNQNKRGEIDTNKLIDYSLKFTALELYKQGEELDSLNNYYDLLDKRTDIIRDSLKNITYKKVINKQSKDSLRKNIEY